MVSVTIHLLQKAQFAMLAMFVMLLYMLIPFKRGILIAMRNLRCHVQSFNPIGKLIMLCNKTTLNVSSVHLSGD